ncbi:MAG TPA: RHS repeat-associated core domain-containing protein, partial [Verrucomicrobiota bacterium]|nr:RHS repeat-associated core domain-containing protein [Verrucomicrobiota bacterium]
NGNITCLVDGAGAVAARYVYDPYGNLIAKAGRLADANLYRFSSKELHVASGLYYYGYRFYEPSLQRWLDQDPIGEQGGINPCNYVGNDPLNRIDALGLWWWDGGCIEWGVGGLLGLKGVPGTADEAWSGFAEGWSKGGQGVINDFTGGLFDSEYGLFYDSFDDLDKDAFGSGITHDGAFRLGSGAGRFAEAALLAAGALYSYEAVTGFRIEVHGTHGWTLPHLQGIQGPGWGKTIWRLPPHSWTPGWWTRLLK